jgi:hypothetical protein
MLWENYEIKGEVKPRTYRKKARKRYLQTIKKKKPGKKVLRKELRYQLSCLNRNLGYIDTFL